MNCGEVRALLDDLMDGALDDRQLREMEAHARECPACAGELRSAARLKALFEQLEPEIDVPLAAQARWRGAVREEAHRQRGKRLIRWAGSVAAGIVVLVGVGLALNLRALPKGDPSAAQPDMKAASAVEAQAYETAELEEAYEASDEAPGPEVLAANHAAVIESDGAHEAADDADAEVARNRQAAGSLDTGASACELSIWVEDVDTACSRIIDLAQEYDGEADVQRLENGDANVYINISAENAGDFFSAVAPMGGGDPPAQVPSASGEGELMLLIQVHAAG